MMFRFGRKDAATEDERRQALRATGAEPAEEV
jgi:hypothetical protein